MSGRPHRHDVVVIVRTLLTAFGGAEHAAARHAVGLRQRGFDVTFVTDANCDRRHPYFLMLRDAGVSVVGPTRWTRRTLVRRVALAMRPLALPFYLLLRPKPLGAAWSSLAAIVDTLLHRLERRSLIELIERCGAGAHSFIVHVYGREGLTPVIASWGAAAGIPIVYTETGEADAVYADRFNLRGTIDSINTIPLVICCGRRVAENIRTVYGYRGSIVEMPFLIEDPVGRADVPHEGIVVGMVGRLVEHKGHRDAIWAVARLRSEGVPVTLIVAGDGPIGEALRTYANEQGVREAVSFIGRFKHVHEVLSRIDVLVLPSTSEGQPLAITEAMAYGKPVVSTWFGGIPDLVAHERTGLLVRPGDRDEFLFALRRLACDGDLRRRMGEAARAEYLAHRSHSTVLDRIERAYQTVRSATEADPSDERAVVAIAPHVS